MPTPPELPPLLHWLNDKLDVAVRAQPLREANELLAFRVDLSRFRLRLSENTPCLVVPADLMRARSAIQLKRQLMDTLLREGWLRRNTLVLADGDAADEDAAATDELKVLCRSEALPPLILDAASQYRIMAGPTNSNVLIEEISKQAPLTALSVYETSAPVQGAQFFGRESELRDILQKSTTSFLIFGNRRMGKTSLVREVLRRLKHESSNSNEALDIAAMPTQLYFDCSIFRNRQEFYAEVIRELDGPREIERLYRDKSFSMVSFLQRIYRARREKIVLCLDEVDHLLAWDSQDSWQVISTLRALAATTQAGAHGNRGSDRDEDRQPLRVIMAGFRRAQAWAENRDTPLFNFASLMRVTNFDHRTTEQLVTEPMFNLGLTLTDRSALVNRIFRETGGQPNLIQHYCDFMVRRLDQTGSREVTPQLLDDVLNDSALRSRVTDELMANASNLEQFIIFSFIQQASAPDRFTLGQADDWLKVHKVELPRIDIEHALTALETSGMLARDGRQYGFAFSVLRRMLSENWDMDYQLRKILEEGLL